MKTHDCTETKHLESEVPFYDFEDLVIIGGTRYIIKASDECNYLRYGDIELGNCSASVYHQLEGVLLSFFDLLFASIHEKECTIIRYEPQWVVRESESPELSLLLHQNGINSNVYGITVSKHDALVKEFVISAFRYNSFIQFLFPRKRIIITPTDHLDLFIDLPTSGSLINQIDLVLKRQGDGVIVSTSRQGRQGDGSSVLTDD